MKPRSRPAKGKRHPEAERGAKPIPFCDRDNHEASAILGNIAAGEMSMTSEMPKNFANTIRVPATNNT